MQSTNTPSIHSRGATMSRESGTSRANKASTERDARDAGPWLALSLPVSLALTLVVVIFLARLSF